MKELNGYLEYNGLIYKIQSIEQLRDFINGLGEKAKEMTEQELAALCVKPNPNRDLDKEYKDYSDSCYVHYSLDGKKLIQGNATLEEYKIADGTLVVCDGAFNLSGKRNNAKKIFCPNTLVAVGELAFCNADVREFIWSDNLKYIGNYAFYGCVLFNQELNLPQSLTYIGANAFSGCRTIVSVSFPDSILKIDSHAFYGCESLTWVYIPDSIETMGSGVFDGCKKLQEIRIPKGSRAKFEKLLPFSIDKFVEV